MASVPVTFDNRQWNDRSTPGVGRAAAPGWAPLRARRDRISVGGTIRAKWLPWQPVFTFAATTCPRHIVIVGATGSGKTKL